MKNSVFIVAVAAMLASCSQSNKQQSSEKELPADSVSTAPEKMADFTSPDRQRLELRGNVSKLTLRSADCVNSKSLEVKGEWETLVYIFNGKGVASCSDQVLDCKDFRNDNGQLVRTETYIPDFRITTSKEYRYKDNGMLDSLITKGLEWSGKTSFSYDSNLNCISSKMTSAEEGTLYERTTTYEIAETDSLGNWTRRYKTTIIKSGSFNCNGNYDSQDTTYGVDVREIVY